MKTFNTAGTCFPEKHYMVDISERIEIIRRMIERGDYFCINRGRQYGKTTTLEGISTKLANEYCIFSISFEGIEDSCYAEEEKFYAKFASLIARSFAWTPLRSLDKDMADSITTFSKEHKKDCSSDDLMYFISEVCHSNSKPVVLLIDEVDQAGNYPTFLKFLGLLRTMFLQRNRIPTFQSVILAGVYDIKNLKLQIRPEEQHQYNSPWNVAVPFDTDMSLHTEGIAQMLAEYKADHALSFDHQAVAQMIHDYTGGYPFLVSRLCQIIDTDQLTWDKEGVLKAVNILLIERNTLFDNMVKKLDDYPELKRTLKEILFTGEAMTFNMYEKYIQIGAMFNYIVSKNGKVAITCRIMETFLYNLFLGEAKGSSIYQEGEMAKNQFVHDGIIDMPHLLERFALHMNQTYAMDKDTKFIENDGRKVFLTFLRPIINGIGSYHIEEQTRDMSRMDVVIDYLGRQYIVELKIWRGDSYNTRGEEQLCRYLDYFHLQTGYLLSFCFNRDKQPGLKPVVEIDGRTLYEVVV